MSQTLQIKKRKDRSKVKGVKVSKNLSKKLTAKQLKELVEKLG